MTFAETVIVEVGAWLEPVLEAADDEDTRAGLFAAIGLEVQDDQLAALEGRFDSIASAYDTLSTVSDGDDETMEDVLAVLDAVADLVDALDGIEADLAPLEDELEGIDVEDVVGSLLEHLTLRYLFGYRPMVLHALVLLAVVDVPTPEERDGAPGQETIPGLPPGVSFEPEQVGDLLENPATALIDAYSPSAATDPADAARIADLLLPILTKIAGMLGCRIAYGTEPMELADYGGVSNLTVASRTLSVFREIGEVGTVGFRMALASSDDGLCLYLVPFGAASLDVDLGDWSFSFTLGGGFDVVVVNPDGVVHASPSTGEVRGDVSLEKLPSGDDAAAVLGPADGSRLELGRLDFSGDWALSGETVEADVSARAMESSLHVSATEGDGFLQKVLPEDGVNVDFDAGLGWSTERGLYFQGGGAGLDTELPVNLSIADVLTVDTLQLAAKPDTAGETVTIPVHVAADPQISLGPIDATVEGIGLEAEIAFPENSDGNLGPLDVDLGFKPPDGAGLSVDAGAVTGGGYLEFDPDNERYAGVLQLQVGELTLTAVGLLTTQLPGGRDGFSLLLIISGEFPPMQLGFGFTLNAVGGLLGINRTMAVDYLVAGVSDGTVNSIMFPEDPVRNAPQIVSDLRNGFPVAAENHVFGPMGRLGWGTPTMLSADIGVLLELPDPIRLVILGRVHAGLPHEEVGIVVFNMDVIGAVDFGEGTADASATLYDSRVLAYTLTGDMAMKTGWGDDPTFVLSVGGFNPRFDPPEDFPELRRIALSLGPGNPRIRWEGYFAMTANTLQVGARVEIYAAAAGFSFEGTVGFDTLFRFDPFELVADFYAGFALMRDGSTIMSVDLDGTLSGPGPWHVTGKASFEIWPLEFSVSVDEEFGQSASAEGLPPADVFGEVVDALGDERNWSAQRPEGGDSVVTLRQVEPKGDQVLAHPLGQFSVRQKVAPLAVRLETYGGATPADYDRFEIVDVAVGEDDEGAGEPTREQFARGEYFDLSDDEKLEGPEFERYEAGSHVTNTGFAWGGMDDDGLLGGGVLEYETAVIDEEASFEPIVVAPIAMPQSTAESLAAVSAVARGPLRTTGAVRFEIDEAETAPAGVDERVSVGDAGFVVGRTDDLTRVDLDLPPDGTTKREAEEALSTHLDAGDRDRSDYQIVGAHETVDGEGDQ